MKIKLEENFRKWTALFISIILYFIIHEGAHLIYAILTNTFKQINFVGIGIQVDISRDKISDYQLGIFCLLGPVATIITAYVLVYAKNIFLKIKSNWLRAISFYTTIAFLIIDPLYLGFGYRFVGGGDMNGIKLIFSEFWTSSIFLLILIVNSVIIFNSIIKAYSKAYKLANNKRKIIE